MFLRDKALKTNARVKIEKSAKKLQFLAFLGRRRDIGFARMYILYIYIYVVAAFFHQLDQGFLFLKMFEKTFNFFDYIDTKGSQKLRS